MRQSKIQYIINLFIASVWFINGFFCKVLGLVPRHQKIVEGILHPRNAHLLTVLIGFAEISMAVWIITGFLRRPNAIIQIIVIALMNSLEFFFVPDLLLWGRMNSLFAFLFIFLIYFNEFVLHRKLTVPA